MRMVTRVSALQYETIEQPETAMTEQTLELSWHKPAGRCACLPDAATTNPQVEAAWRHRMVREAAYYRSLQRPSGEGKELEDWLAAEKEVDTYATHSHD
jgi:Protein of unknown function (DUF2934)